MHSMVQKSRILSGRRKNQLHISDRGKERGIRAWNVRLA